jgi:hypothetical protein
VVEREHLSVREAQKMTKCPYMARQYIKEVKEEKKRLEAKAELPQKSNKS